MSEKEIEILGHKQEFIIKITNKLIMWIVGCSFGIIASGSWWASGFVGKVNDHERRITTVEGHMYDIQGQQNRQQRIHNDRAGESIGVTKNDK